jgi:DNA-binding NarL/FixJ family response regulator
MDTSKAELQEWIPQGFQVYTARRPRKNVPEWARSNRSLMARIFQPAIRRYNIAYLYWRVGWTAKEIAEELGQTVSSVKRVIERLSGTTSVVQR